MTFFLYIRCFPYSLFTISLCLKLITNCSNYIFPCSNEYFPCSNEYFSYSPFTISLCLKILPIHYSNECFSCPCFYIFLYLKVIVNCSKRHFSSFIWAFYMLKWVFFLFMIWYTNCSNDNFLLFFSWSNEYFLVYGCIYFCVWNSLLIVQMTFFLVHMGVFHVQMSIFLVYDLIYQLFK